MKSHLVILNKIYIDAILDGCKTIESRLLKSKCPPFNCVSPGDKLFLKASGLPVGAVAYAAQVKQYDNLTPSQIDMIRKIYGRQILGDNSYWRLKKDSKFAVLVWLKNVRPIEPIPINKKDWRAWVVLRPGSDFGLLAPRPFLLAAD